MYAEDRNRIYVSGEANERRKKTRKHRKYTEPRQYTNLFLALSVCARVQRQVTVLESALTVGKVDSKPVKNTCVVDRLTLCGCLLEWEENSPFLCMCVYARDVYMRTKHTALCAAAGTAFSKTREHRKQRRRKNYWTKNTYPQGYFVSSIFFSCIYGMNVSEQKKSEERIKSR